MAGLALAMALGGAAAAAAAPPKVETPLGRLAGVKQGDAEAFLGVPYAQPPVGSLRWRAPVPVEPWQGVHDASKLGFSCYQGPPIQAPPYTHEYTHGPPPSEDCLYLNVWKPAHAGRRAPVLVWLPGGGFLSGSGAVAIYNGAELAAQGAVVVTLNYRLGPFGFLAHPDLSREAADHVSGNYGFLDVIEALRWVRRNIASFGGDPRNVTVAGQSAGAAMVDDLLVSPAARGLLAKAIAESGSGMALSPLPLQDAERIGLKFADKLGASNLAQLRSASAEAVLHALPIIQPPRGASSLNPTFGPVVGGDALPVDPDDLAAKVQTAAPLITGFNTDEIVRPGDVRTPAGFESGVRARYGAAAERFLALYPHATEAEASASQALLARDRYMASLLLWIRTRDCGTSIPTYAYLFDHPVPTLDGETWGAFHTGEVPYVFGTLDPADRPYGDKDQAVAAQMSGYWLAFMKTGDPNHPGAVPWRKAEPGTLTVMGLGDTVGARAAVSSPDRFKAFKAFVQGGGRLSLF